MSDLWSASMLDYPAGMDALSASQRGVPQKVCAICGRERCVTEDPRETQPSEPQNDRDVPDEETR